jgi:hypothetical protein
MNEKNTPSTTRRGMMKGIGGLAALSMSSATLAEAQEAMAADIPTDPHTRDTYRAIVDAIVPRTPQLEDELGPEHVPGGLDVELEKFLIWDFNHFQEIRLETLKTPIETKLPTGGGGVGGLTDTLSGLDGVSGLTGATGSGDDPTGVVDGVTQPVEGLVDGLMQPELFQLELVPGEAGSPLAALTELTEAASLEELTGLLDLEGIGLDELGEPLDFGGVDRAAIGFADAPIPSDAEGIAEFDLLFERGSDVTHRVLQNYPYAAVFPFAFDLVAAEFIALGRNEDAISRDPTEFPGGGTFAQLSRQDRLRCLWTIVEGGVLDRLDALLSPLLPTVGILKYVVMAVNGLHGFGYYTEWSGLGNTKTNTPQERVQEVPAGEVQSRQQSGYPGPQPGFAADWRRPVHEQTGGRGFADPDVNDLDLPQDLTGDDVIDGVDRPAGDEAAEEESDGPLGDNPVTGEESGLEDNPVTGGEDDDSLLGDTLGVLGGDS